MMVIFCNFSLTSAILYYQVVSPYLVFSPEYIKMVKSLIQFVVCEFEVEVDFKADFDFTFVVIMQFLADFDFKFEAELQVELIE